MTSNGSRSMSHPKSCLPTSALNFQLMRLDSIELSNNYPKQTAPMGVGAGPLPSMTSWQWRLLARCRARLSLPTPRPIDSRKISGFRALARFGESRSTWHDVRSPSKICACVERIQWRNGSPESKTIQITVLVSRSP